MHQWNRREHGGWGSDIESMEQGGRGSDIESIREEDKVEESKSIPESTIYVHLNAPIKIIYIIQDLRQLSHTSSLLPHPS